MESKLITELHVANRNDKWEVFFPHLEEAMYSCEDLEDATAWAHTLAGESGYTVVIK